MEEVKEYILSSIDEHNRGVLSNVMYILENNPIIIGATIQYASFLINNYIKSKLEENTFEYDLCISKIAGYTHEDAKDRMIDSDKKVILKSINRMFGDDKIKEVKEKYNID